MTLSATGKLAAFAAVLAAVFGVGYGIGAAVDGDGDSAPPPTHQEQHTP